MPDWTDTQWREQLTDTRVSCGSMWTPQTHGRTTPIGLDLETEFAETGVVSIDVLLAILLAVSDHALIARLPCFRARTTDFQRLRRIGGIGDGLHGSMTGGRFGRRRRR